VAGKLDCTQSDRLLINAPAAPVEETWMVAKVAIITGAGTGIGRAVAIALSQRSYRLVLVGRRTESLHETAAGLASTANLVISADVTDAAAVDALFDAVVTRFGRVDLLFNNAGINTRAVPVDELSVAEWREVMDVNLTGAFLCLRAAFRVMKAQRPQGGRIINNGSISAQSPRPHSMPYTASKHAISGLTKCAALDGRAFDIACGQIDIGNAATGLTAGMKEGVMQPDGARRSEPVMDVALVGETVAFMDSLPLEANVQFLTVMATKMPFIGRG